MLRFHPRTSVQRTRQMDQLSRGSTRATYLHMPSSSVRMDRAWKTMRKCCRRTLNK